jgi:hypothetical protein
MTAGQKRRLLARLIGESFSVCLGDVVSVFAATTFLKHHNLRLRSATIKTVLGQEEIETLVQHFLTSCHHVNKLKPQLTCENIVQMDEVATTMCGFMKAPMSFVQNRDDSPCSIVQTCDLDSDKKLCTGLHFLSAVFIPPILLFKGAEGPVPS